MLIGWMCDSLLTDLGQNNKQQQIKEANLWLFIIYPTWITDPLTGSLCRLTPFNIWEQTTVTLIWDTDAPWRINRMHKHLRKLTWWDLLPSGPTASWFNQLLISCCTGRILFEETSCLTFSPPHAHITMTNICWGLLWCHQTQWVPFS